MHTHTHTHTHTHIYVHTHLLHTPIFSDFSIDAMTCITEEEWNALSRREQAEKDMFLRNEEHVGSGFMRQVSTFNSG